MTSESAQVATAKPAVERNMPAARAQDPASVPGPTQPAGRSPLASIIPYSLRTHLGVTRSTELLPKRIRDLVLEHEERSERLIGWVQLGMIAVFGLLFALAPRPEGRGMLMLEPVVVAITAYALFTIGRLLLSYRGFMPGWLLVLSMLVDVALLFGLIWSFHIQYEQIAAFSLKIPTFIYVFVFIALRALRFDPRFVLSSGLFAALGWLAIVWLAVESGGEEVVTRNFVEYLTANRILIGAEFDKVFTISLMTLVLTFAVWRARQMLVTAFREEAASREYRRFLASDVADAISGADTSLSAGDAEERDCAVIMLDIRGFTSFATSVDPKQAVDMLTSLHERIVPAVAENNGLIDKFLGDGVMITFGAVTPTKTPVADALRALDQIMDRAEQWTREQPPTATLEPLTVNGAMAAGRVVFAVLGNADRLEYTVIGPTVNLAAKLEKHNKTEATRALVPLESYELGVQQGYRPPGISRERRKGRKIAGVATPIDLLVHSQ